MTTETLLSILAILGLLVCSGFFSGSETAMTGASRARMHALEQQGSRAATIVNRMWLRKERLIGAILLGNNLVNIAASAIATSVAITLVGENGVFAATVVMTLLVLIFSEVLPKTYAIHHADRMAVFVGPILRVFVVVFGPVNHAIFLVVRATFKIFGVDIGSPIGAEQSEEELRGAIDLHAGGSEEVRQERQMLRSILDLGDVEVGEIMTHRKNVVTVNADLPIDELITEVLSTPYTRVPMWRGTPDNIVGVIHAKELFRAAKELSGQEEKIDVAEVANPPWFIPDATDLLSQLQSFRQRHEHFAIVVDEYGEVLGIVTLEDILEEIVGDIADEHDVEIEGVRQLKDGAVIVEGTVTIRDLNRQFEWKLPDEEASTIAGLVLHEARRIPEIGQVFVFHGFRFEILGRQRNQVTSLKVTPLDENGEEATETAEAEA
ncbi:HlyC/CorC family transporter [Rhodovibrio salinarum]|uniref:HlyC/CorC family transporter n=1 Tax=Rhodovibrio salinarum TaxID=1087 RepID=A0A934QL19_9PROT|nr:HlyC/CorC family transporter [Rhodovibrio salinarum]MBK1698484.1 HlyC/CorC family transporter [Rhodovibrio salinarum]